MDLVKNQVKWEVRLHKVSNNMLHGTNTQIWEEAHYRIRKTINAIVHDQIQIQISNQLEVNHGIG